MYSDGASWKNWMKDYRFGTIVFLPTGEVREVGDRLRRRYDSVSANTCAAHITVTQPFTSAPDDTQLSMIEELIELMPKFDARIGPATTSPNKRLVWLDVHPKDKVLNIRERLHDMGLFRTDLPLTKGFIPHLTISETQRDPEEVQSINEHLNSSYSPWSISFGSVAWIVPDDNFVFQERRVFRLKDV